MVEEAIWEQYGSTYRIWAHLSKSVAYETGHKTAVALVPLYSVVVARGSAGHAVTRLIF